MHRKLRIGGEWSDDRGLVALRAGCSEQANPEAMVRLFVQQGRGQSHLRLSS